MSHPVLWCPKPFFYAIGNTPPVCFTKNLAPEEPARVLLLGCGDPRSILYTVHANLGKTTRTLDFTCCDLEPAILARNIILLTLIVDGITPVECWRIFYHYLLDANTRQTLKTQCQRLIEASATIETWNISSYGRYTRYCTSHSLYEVRRHWRQYLDTIEKPEKEQVALQNAFKQGMKEGRSKIPDSAVTLVAMRSAAPVFDMNSGAIAGHAVFEMYWSEGVIKSPTLGRPVSTYSNPLFLFSLAGRMFYPHYASNPIIGYSLARPFATSSIITSENLVESALDQFNAWCASFKRRIEASPTSTVIRVFTGDCLTFCQALHTCGSQRKTSAALQNSPFGITQISLDKVDYSADSPRAPLIFNVIETSNLIDHLGLLNILVVTVPILERTPWAAIHTNSLIRSTIHGAASSALVDRTLADVPTLSLLLGVAPAAYLSPFTTHSDKHEILLSMMKSNYQFHESIAWRFPSCVVAESHVRYPELEDHQIKLHCDATHLAKFLFSVYLKMFLEEDPKAPWSLMAQRLNIVHYNRASFADFLGVIKTRVEVDWRKTMDLLLLLIQHDKTLSGSSKNFEDLICQLHLRGIFTRETVWQNHGDETKKKGSIFEGWKGIPPVVCVVLEVPRRSMRSFEVMDREQILTPILYCQLRGDGGYHMQTSIRPVFGRLSTSGQNESRTMNITEDSEAWEGDSALIVSFDVQSWLLTKEGSMSTLDFKIRTTETNIASVRKMTGGDGTIYSTSINDAEHVYILRHRPNDSRDIGDLKTPTPTPTSSAPDTLSQVTIAFDDSSSKVTTMVRRENLKKAEDKDRLSNGAEVQVKLLVDNALLASFEGWEKSFAYPFPVRGDQRKTRIARKSSYIEIEVPVRPHFENHQELSLNYFPMARSLNGFNLVNMHYINLDVLPSLPQLSTESLTWLNNHLSLMMSNEERALTHRQKGDLEALGLLVNLKETIASFFLNMSGLRGERSKYPIMAFSEPELGIYCLIFINGLKFDLAENTVVVDACVLPGTLKTLQRAMSFISKHVAGKGSVTTTLADEMRVWKILLPSFAERCRTWSHTPNCEYQTNGIPACGEWTGVYGNLESPLCSCGKGKNLGRFDTVKEWQSLRSEVTRIAIGPLFSFSSLDIMGISKAKTESVSPSTSGPKTEMCKYCGEKKQSLLVCSRCKTAKYCSADCQRSHWKVHKTQCKQN